MIWSFLIWACEDPPPTLPPEPPCPRPQAPAEERCAIPVRDSPLVRRDACGVPACTEVLQTHPDRFPALMQGHATTSSGFRCRVLEAQQPEGVEAYVAAMEAAPVDVRRDAYVSGSCIGVGTPDQRADWARRLAHMMAHDNGAGCEQAEWLVVLRDLDPHVVDNQFMAMAFDPMVDNCARRHAVSILIRSRSTGELALTPIEEGIYRAWYEQAYTVEQRRAVVPLRPKGPEWPSDDQTFRAFAVGGRVVQGDVVTVDLP